MGFSYNPGIWVLSGINILAPHQINKCCYSCILPVYLSAMQFIRLRVCVYDILLKELNKYDRDFHLPSANVHDAFTSPVIYRSDTINVLSRRPWCVHFTGDLSLRHDKCIKQTSMMRSLHRWSIAQTRLNNVYYGSLWMSKMDKILFF